MNLKKAKIADLKVANYNPKDRTKEGAKGLSQLAKSIEKAGLVYPIAVTSKMEVVDGHRRLAAVKRLGWEEVPILVVIGDRDTIYAEVNANSNSLSGNDNLAVWLKNPAAVTAYAASLFEKAEELVGRTILSELVKRKHSIRTVGRAKQIANYVGRDDLPFLKKTIKWLMKTRGLTIVLAFLRTQQSPKILYNCIVKNQDLQAKFVS